MTMIKLSILTKSQMSIIDNIVHINNITYKIYNNTKLKELKMNTIFTIFLALEETVK